MAAKPVVLEVDKLRSASGTDVEVDKIIPGVVTSSGEVLTFDGSDYQKDASFAQTSYVNTEISNLRGTATTNYDDLGKIEGEISTLVTDYQNADTNLQTQITDNDSDITDLQNDVATNSTNLAQEVTDRTNADTAIIGGASATHDTLGKVEGVINAIDSAYQAADTNLQNQITDNDSDIISIQADVAANTLNIATNTTDIAQEETDRIAADAAIIGGASTTHDTLGKIEGVINAIDSAYQAADTNLQNSINTEITDRASGDTAIIGGASTTHDTLGKVEAILNTVQSDLSGKAPIPTADTMGGEVLTYVSGAFVNDSSFATKTQLTTDLGTAISNVVGNATAAGDTLEKLENSISSNASSITLLQSSVANKSDVPAVDSSATEVLRWVSGAFVQDSSFAKLTDVSDAVTALVDSAVTLDTIGKLETALNTKAAEPPNGIQPGEFLRWDEINKQFTFATPSTGSSGSTIPTPASTTDYANGEILIWDSSAGDLKNVSVDYAKVNGATTYTDLALVETALDNRAPKPTVSNTGEYLSWDGNNFVNSTPAGGSGGGASGPSAPSATGEVVTFNGSTFENNSDFSLKPTSNSISGHFLQWDSSLNSGMGGFKNTAAPANSGGTLSLSGHVVQVVENPQVGGEALSATGYSTKGFASITQASANSQILFITSGVPIISGVAWIYVHWRYRDTLSSAWSAYQDTGKVKMRLTDKSGWAMSRDSGIGLHYPARPAGAEIEYRVYFEILVGTVYYPDPNETTAITNMVLQEISA